MSIFKTNDQIPYGQFENEVPPVYNNQQIQRNDPSFIQSQPVQGNVGMPNVASNSVNHQPLLNNQVIYVNPDQANHGIDFDYALTLSCLVFFLFNFICGGIAFTLAILGVASRRPDNNEKTRCLRKSSYIVSIVGLLVAIFLWLLMLTIILGNYLNSTHYHHQSNVVYD